ncbi:MAG: DUF2339 domain-containing protein, partial [Candidatus Hydrogenedentes bacterium]|nr:DUF2339 domain-containing protein [Candidatus Hydrogenedentota bacterium]
AMSVLAVYFLIFALAEYVAPAELRRRAVSFRLRSAYASFNSAAFFVLGYSIMRGFDFARDYTYVFYFALAAVLAVFAFSYWLRRAADPLHNLYFTKAASVATLGFATYFDGAILTATLAVEAVVLLMGARRSGLVVSRLLAHAVAVLAFFHGLYVVFEMPWPATYGDPAFAGMTTSSAVAVLALLVGALLYQRTDWSTRGVGVGTRTDTDGGGEGLVEWLARRPNLHALLWQHDLVVTAPREGLNKPLEGLLYPYSYTFGAAILGVLFTNRLLEQVHTAPALGLLALTLTVAGVLLSNKPYTSGALIWAVFGAFAWLLAAFVEIPADALNFRDHMYDAPRYAEYLVSGVFALLPLLLLAELVRLARPQDTTLWLRGRHADDPTPLPDIYALSAFLVLLTGVIVLAEPGHRLLALAMAAAAFGGYALVVPAPAIGTLPFLASVSSAVFFTGEVVDGLPALTLGAALVLLAGAAVLSEQRYLADRHGLRRLQDLAPPYFLYGVVAWLFGVYAVFTWDSPPDVLALLCGGVVLVAVSAVLNPGACGAWSVFLLAWAYAHWIDASAAASPVLWHGAALGIIVAALAGERWLHLQAPQVRVQRWGMHFVAWAAALSYLHDAVPPQWHLALWGLSAFAWLAWAGATRPLSALVFGLLAAILTTFALLAESYGDALRTGPLIAGYSVVILFWLGIERLQAWSAGLERTPQWLREQYWRSILVSLPCVLLVLMLERIPLLASYYLTISWTAAALAAFGVALATRERWYRYAGLGVFLLALGRVFLVDLRELQPIFRVLAFIVLGAVLLAVAYGYLLARQRMRESVESTRS